MNEHERLQRIAKNLRRLVRERGHGYQDWLKMVGQRAGGREGQNGQFGTGGTGCMLGGYEVRLYSNGEISVVDASGACDEILFLANKTDNTDPALTQPDVVLSVVEPLLEREFVLESLADI